MEIKQATKLTKPEEQPFLLSEICLFNPFISYIEYSLIYIYKHMGQGDITKLYSITNNNNDVFIFDLSIVVVHQCEKRT